MIRSTKNSVLYIYTLLLITILSACKEKGDYQNKLIVDWESARNIYLKHINVAILQLDTLKTFDAQSKEAKETFKELRIAFKQAEPYASYLNPDVGHRANGPALPIYKEDNGKTLSPVGLQKIEESIYDGGVTQEQFLNELNILEGLLNNLKRNIEKRELTAERFFTATHQQLLRIISLSISGFDTPVSKLGINESAISLTSLYEVYKISIKKVILKNNPKLDTTFQNQIQAAVDYVGEHQDFDTFDRYTFLRDYLNPITRTWVSIRKSSNLWDGVSSMPLNFNAPTFFENDSFKTEFFTTATNRNATPEQITLGKKLFFDENISEAGTMSCATCHIPEQGYTDGLKVNKNNTGGALLRNTPTLINSALQRNFFWDGRSATLLDQISSVFINEDEFNTSVHIFSENIMQDTTYIKLFDKAYGGIKNQNKDVIRAISSYITTLNGFDSKFDRNIRAEENTFTAQEKNGLNLFMGKALCATCHFMPLTNGTVPPFFKETEKEVIGVPETNNNKKLDDDLGFYWKFEEELHRGMFKTPTVRNAALTGPYMHNGVYETLEEVIDFYNKGGGGGLGFDLEYQTLPFENLELTDEEQKALVAFLKTLTDDKVDQY